MSEYTDTDTDTTYADGLLRAVSSPKLLQARMDLMSAWICLSNVRMPLSKVKCAQEFKTEVLRQHVERKR